MSNKFTTIKLRPDVSTIVFEHFDQTTETTIEPANMNSFAQLSNYQFLTVEKFPDERESESLAISRKNNNEIHEITAPSREFQEFTVPSDEPPPPFETPFEIKMIATAPLFHVYKQKKSKTVLGFPKKRKKKPSSLNVILTQLPSGFTSSTNFSNCFLRKKLINCPRTAFMTTKSTS